MSCGVLRCAPHCSDLFTHGVWLWLWLVSYRVRFIKAGDFTLPRLMMKEMHEMAASGGKMPTPPSNASALTTWPPPRPEASGSSNPFANVEAKASTQQSAEDGRRRRSAGRRASSTPAGLKSRARRISVGLRCPHQCHRHAILTLLPPAWCPLAGERRGCIESKQLDPQQHHQRVW